jgi:hypothetical protein
VKNPSPRNVRRVDRKIKQGSFAQSRNRRLMSITEIGRFRAAKLVPIMAHKVGMSEGGMMSQLVTFEVDPIAGRMVTPMYGEVHAVFVPAQAMDMLKNPAVTTAGVTEMMRMTLASGVSLFNLETESEISMRCAVQPVSIGGVLMVNEAVRLAANCAVNWLRRERYHKAVQLDKNNTAITPAIISDTVLDRFRGVLDPDDRVNGKVPIVSGNIILPVEGLGLENTNGTATLSPSVRETGDAANETYTNPANAANTAAGSRLFVKTTQQGPGYRPDINARLNNVVVGSLSRSDFYQAEKAQMLLDAMRAIVEEDPVHGEAQILRWVHGLRMDDDKQCYTLASRRIQLGRAMAGATDSAGVIGEVVRSDIYGQIEITYPIVPTELGGVVVIFASLKPDETVPNQPDPFFSEPWVADNHVADELAIDPVPIKVRNLDHQSGAGPENTTMFFTGLNRLKSNYVHYGLNRLQDPNTVENKTAVWQFKLPASVTPDNILYTDNFPQYPFADQNAQVCRYSVASMVRIETPLVFGPDPKEEMAIISTQNIFEGQA